MTVRLDWPPELVARLTEEANREGLSLDAYLRQLVLRRRIPVGATPDEVAKREREEAGKSIRELRKGNVLGPDLSARSD